MAAKKDKPRKIHAKILVELTVPHDIWESLSPKDRMWLEDIARVKGWDFVNGRTLIYNIENINKLRNLFYKYNTVIAYPESAVLRHYGLRYSKDSLEVKVMGDAFEIIQYMPDGSRTVKYLPKEHVFKLMYAIYRYMCENNLMEIPSKTVWEIASRAFNLRQFFTYSGEFKSDKFFGSRRWYFYYAYYPLKILDFIGKLRYTGSTVSVVGTLDSICKKRV